MNVLVTGNKGYIGSLMVGKLVEEGYDVTGLDTSFYGECNFYEINYDVKQINKDIRNISRGDLNNIDAVIHLAALSNDPTGALNPNLTDDINHVASVNLAKLARDEKVERYLFSSSCSMYGIASSDEMLTETAPFNPVTSYARSKVDTEKDVSKLATDSFAPVFLRNGTAYGVAPNLRMDLVLNNLVGWAFTTGQVKIMSDGTPWRPIIHVEDITNAFIAALEAPLDSVNNQAFNVGANSENYQIKDMAEAVKRIVPDCEITYSMEHGSDSRTYKVDFSKIKKTLPKFKPTWDLEKGAREIYSAFKEYGLTVEEMNTKYNRLYNINQLISSARIDKNLMWYEKL